jgi:hypothetical protein
VEASYTIIHAVYQSGGTDADGYPIPEGHADPVERLVYGWYPQTSEIPVGNDELAQRVITNKIVMVPDVSMYGPGDLIAFPGDDINDDESAYRVSEDVRDFNTGPFGYKPGGAIVVERVRG